MRTILYTAAHGGFDLNRVPLGGAAAVCGMLMQTWRDQKNFRVRLLTPELLGSAAPKEKDLVRYSELRYARFCFDFENALTAEILRQDPAETVVLSNDISEGPDFRRLAKKGYPIYTLYHVDVVDYFTRFYLGHWLSPESAVKKYEYVRRSPLNALLPKVLKLVFQKQRDSVLYSRGIIVPSAGMKTLLQRCYPEAAPEKIQVMPWGLPDVASEQAAVEARVAALREQYGLSADAQVLLTLSRISPEKGQDRLLKALILGEQRGEWGQRPLWLFLCGEAAYMKGRRYEKKLRSLARQLKRVRVVFPGHLAGMEKAAHLQLADLYVFPSVHESYGLTLLEAFQAGLPALTCTHYGAEGLIRPEVGELIPDARESEIPGLMMDALKRLLADPARLKQMGAQARQLAKQYPFSQTADRLGRLLLGDLSVGSSQPVNKQVVHGRV